MSEQANQEQKLNIKTVGAKGVFLQDMFQAGVLVPAGFIMTRAYEEFMEHTGLYARIETCITANKVSLNDMNSILQCSNETMSLVKETPFPESLREKVIVEFSKLKSEFVAIRYSLTVDDTSSSPLSRELVSRLNVKKSDFLDGIKNAWAQFFSPASIAYRLEKNIKSSDSLAVLLVQRMIDGESSGVSFTKHPITGDTDQVVIEASFGLNEEINTRGIVKDTYIISKGDWKILGKKVLPQKKMLSRVGSETSEVDVGSLMQEKQKLSDAQILALANLSKKIEDFYSQVPQKIEWVFSKNNFYILQSQPMAK